VTTTLDGNVEILSRAILAEAEAEIEGVRSASQSQAEGILDRSRVRAEQERSAILEKARQEARRLKGQATATAQLKARKEELEHREELLRRVFDAAEQRLREIGASKDMADVVPRLLQEALGQLRTSPAVVRADPRSRALLTKSVLDRIARESAVELVLGEPLADEGTGVIVQSPDGRLQFDNTLENRLGRMRAALRAEVYRVLTGEVV
jgi:vacuolar-type H+-ATPase subunit E/Vma4